MREHKIDVEKEFKRLRSQLSFVPAGTDAVVGNDGSKHQLTAYLRTPRHVLLVGPQSVGKTSSLWDVVQSVNSKRSDLEGILGNKASEIRTARKTDIIALYSPSSKDSMAIFHLPSSYGKELAEDLGDFCDLLKKDLLHIGDDETEERDIRSEVRSLLLQKYSAKLQAAPESRMRFALKAKRVPVDEFNPLKHLELEYSVLKSPQEKNVYEKCSETFESKKKAFDETADRLRKQAQRKAKTDLKNDPAALKERYGVSRKDDILQKHEAALYKKALQNSLQEMQNQLDALSFGEYQFVVDHAKTRKGYEFKEIHGYLDSVQAQEEIRTRRQEAKKLIRSYAKEYTELSNQSHRETKYFSHLESLAKKWSQRKDVQPELILALQDLRKKLSEELLKKSGKVQLEHYSANLMVDSTLRPHLPFVQIDSLNYHEIFGEVKGKAGENQLPHMRVQLGHIFQAHNGVMYLRDAGRFFQDEVLCNALDAFLKTGRLQVHKRELEEGPMELTPSIPLDVQIYASCTQEELEALQASATLSLKNFKTIHYSWLAKNSPLARSQFASFVQKETSIPLKEAAIEVLLEQSILASQRSEYLSSERSSLRNLLILAQQQANVQNSKAIDERLIRKVIHEQNRSVQVAAQALIFDTITDRLPYTGDSMIGYMTGLSYEEQSGMRIGSPFFIQAVAYQQGHIPEFTDQNAGLVGLDSIKGFEIGVQYLGKKYGIADIPVTLNWVGEFNESSGPSASGACVLAVISALAGLPMDSRLSYTGTIMSADGHIGPIGGVYEKVRGAYDYAKAVQGKDHGSVIPVSNVDEFLLAARSDAELWDACKSGAYRMYAWQTIDEGLAIGAIPSDSGRYSKISQKSLVHNVHSAVQAAVDIFKKDERTSLQQIAQSLSTLVKSRD